MEKTSGSATLISLSSDLEFSLRNMVTDEKYIGTVCTGMVLMDHNV